MYIGTYDAHNRAMVACKHWRPSPKVDASMLLAWTRPRQSKQTWLSRHKKTRNEFLILSRMQDLLDPLDDTSHRCTATQAYESSRA